MERERFLTRVKLNCNMKYLIPILFLLSCTKKQVEPVPVLIPESIDVTALPHCMEFGPCDIYDDKTEFPEKNGIVRVRIWLDCCRCLSYWNLTYSDQFLIDKYIVPGVLEELAKVWDLEPLAVVVEAQEELKTDCLK